MRGIMSRMRDPDRSPVNRLMQSTDERVVLHEYLDELVQREQPDLKATVERRNFVLREAGCRATTLLWLILALVLLGIGSLIMLVVLTPQVAGSQFSTSSRNYHLLVLAAVAGAAFIMIVGLTAAYGIGRSVERASRLAARSDLELAESAQRGIEKLRTKYH
jgi:hypothetical protein